MSYIHILRDNHRSTPWWRCDEYLGVLPDKKIWCDCCNCWGRADEMEARMFTDFLPIGWEKDPGDYQYGLETIKRYDGKTYTRPYGYRPSYYDPRIETRCGEGFGCTVKPRRRASRHLRERW